MKTLNIAKYNLKNGYKHKVILEGIEEGDHLDFVEHLMQQSEMTELYIQGRGIRDDVVTSRRNSSHQPRFYTELDGPRRRLSDRPVTANTLTHE